MVGFSSKHYPCIYRVIQLNPMKRTKLALWGALGVLATVGPFLYLNHNRPAEPFETAIVNAPVTNTVEQPPVEVPPPTVASQRSSDWHDRYVFNDDFVVGRIWLIKDTIVSFFIPDERNLVRARLLNRSLETICETKLTRFGQPPTSAFPPQVSWFKAEKSDCPQLFSAAPFVAAVLPDAESTGWIDPTMDQIQKAQTKLQSKELSWLEEGQALKFVMAYRKSDDESNVNFIFSLAKNPLKSESVNRLLFVNSYREEFWSPESFDFLDYRDLRESAELLSASCAADEAFRRASELRSKSESLDVDQVIELFEIENRILPKLRSCLEFRNDRPPVADNDQDSLPGLFRKSQNPVIKYFGENAKDFSWYISESGGVLWVDSVLGTYLEKYKGSPKIDQIFFERELESFFATNTLCDETFFDLSYKGYGRCNASEGDENYQAPEVFLKELAKSLEKANTPLKKQSAKTIVTKYLKDKRAYYAKSENYGGGGYVPESGEAFFRTVEQTLVKAVK